MSRLEEIQYFLADGFETFLVNFVTPNKRIHWLYLISSLLLAIYVYWRLKRKKPSLLKYLFNKKVWLSKSARIDYFFIVFNSYIKVLLIAPYLILGLYMGAYITDYLSETYDWQRFNLSQTEVLVYYTVSLTLMTDFFAFFFHWLMHKIPFLWEFHKIHHSATVLNPITQYRIHPVELLIVNARNIAIFGFLLGVFDYLSQAQIQTYQFLGANVLSFIFLFWGSNLRHSHVQLKYFNFLEYIFISPFQHQIHHSNKPEHFNKNMGAKLAIWDWMFGTLVRSKEAKIRYFGLGTKDDQNYTSFWKNLYMPFKNIFLQIKRIFSQTSID